MQKILELTSKDWMSGISLSGHLPGTGVFSEASGINPFTDNHTTTYQTGLLQTSAAPNEIQSTVVVDEVIGGTFNGAAFKGYFMGDEGHFYELNTSSYATPSDLRSSTQVTNPADGMEIFKLRADASPYLYFAQRTQIGRWDLSGTYPTGWNDNYIGSGGAIATADMQSTDIRPFHQFLGNIFFGNKDYIGVISDQGTTTPFADPKALDLPSNLTVTTISDDGYYLVFGATSNTISGNTQVNTLNKIFFWDTSANSWQKEYTLDVAWIGSIKRVGDVMYAVTSGGIYAFAFGLRPTLVLPLSNADTLSRTAGVSPTNDLTAVRNNVLFWLSGKPDVCAFGSPIPGLGNRFYRPFQSVGTVPTYLAYPDKFRMILAGATAKFAELNTASTGGTGKTAETIYIPLGRKWDINRIEIITGEPLASGDDVSIKLQSDEDTTETEFGDFTFALHGAKRSHLMVGSYEAENLKIIVSFDGGNVKVKKINVYAEPVTIS